MTSSGHEACRCICGLIHALELEQIWKCLCGRSWQMIKDGNGHKLDYLGNRKVEVNENPAKPQKEKETVKLSFAKRWVVNIDPPRAGLRKFAIDALERTGLTLPLEPNNGRIVLPGVQAKWVPILLDDMKRSIEKSGNIQVGYVLPENLGDL